MFKVTSTGPTRGIPSRPQLERIKRFLANSLLLALKFIQMSTEEVRSGGGSNGRFTVTIQVRSRHRAGETVKELKKWLDSSLEGILVEEGLWETGTGSSAPDIPKIIEVLGDQREESPIPGEGDAVRHTLTLAEFLSSHFQAKWTKEIEGGGLPSSCILPPRDLVKGRKSSWRSGLKDLMRWISGGRLHLYGGILSGCLLPEGTGAPDEEAALIESRKDELCVAMTESVENGWSFLRGLGAPAEISLTGPNPIPGNFDLGDFLTRTLEKMGAFNTRCEQCGARFTAIFPDCTAGTCWYCTRHKGRLCCEICEGVTDLSGDWVDGTRLVDDSLSLDFHDMGSFLISEIRGVRLVDRPRSETPHDRL